MTIGHQSPGGVSMLCAFAKDRMRTRAERYQNVSARIRIKSSTRSPTQRGLFSTRSAHAPSQEEHLTDRRELRSSLRNGKPLTATADSST